MNLRSGLVPIEVLSFVDIRIKEYIQNFLDLVEGDIAERHAPVTQIASGDFR